MPVELPRIGTAASNRSLNTASQSRIGSGTCSASALPKLDLGKSRPIFPGAKPIGGTGYGNWRVQCTFRTTLASSENGLLRMQRERDLTKKRKEEEAAERRLR